MVLTARHSQGGRWSSSTAAPSPAGRGTERQTPSHPVPLSSSQNEPIFHRFLPCFIPSDFIPSILKAIAASGADMLTGQPRRVWAQPGGGLWPRGRRCPAPSPRRRGARGAELLRGESCGSSAWRAGRAGTAACQAAASSPAASCGSSPGTRVGRSRGPWSSGQWIPGAAGAAVLWELLGRGLALRTNACGSHRFKLEF